MAVKRGITPLGAKSQLHDMVTLVFSGLCEEGGKIRAGMSESEFSTVKMHKVINRLSREFPVFFPGYCESHLENVLFYLGAFGVVPLCGSGMRFQKISPEIKKVFAKQILESLALQ